MTDMIAYGNIILVVTAMIGLHIFADFHLQGILTDFKQKKWWMDNVFTDGFNHKYDKDYLAALLIHSLEWSVFVHTPVLILAYNFRTAYSSIFLVLFASILIQAAIHALIDHMKCNKLKINLIQDQFLHIIQLILIFITYFIGNLM